MMSDPLHELYRRMIDDALADESSALEKPPLSAHLQVCRECREYLDASTRTIAALGDFSFEVDGSLQAKVIHELRRRSFQTKPARFSSRRLTSVCALALLFATVGSLLDIRFGDAIASMLPVAHPGLRGELLTFWIVPSLTPLLLFPLLPLLGRRDGRVA